MHFNNLFDIARLCFVTAVTLYALGVIEIAAELIFIKGRPVLSILWVPATAFAFIGMIILLMAIPA